MVGSPPLDQWIYGKYASLQWKLNNNGENTEYEKIHILFHQYFSLHLS